MQGKLCHRGLRPRSRLLGLEPIDLLLLFPGLYVCVVLLEEMLWGLVLTAVVGTALRLMKLQRLGGFSRDLLLYWLFPSSCDVLGTEQGPLYREVKGKPTAISRWRSDDANSKAL